MRAARIGLAPIIGAIIAVTGIPAGLRIRSPRHGNTAHRGTGRAVARVPVGDDQVRPPPVARLARMRELRVDRPHERNQLLAGQLAAGELHERCGGLVAANPRSAAVGAVRPSALGEAPPRPACRVRRPLRENSKPGVVIAHAGSGPNPIVK